MKKIRLTILLFLLPLMPISIALSDQTKPTLNKTNSKLRIVSLNPSLTEILFAMGLGPAISGTTDFSDYPEQAKKVGRVGTYLKPNVEKIVALEPTHILAYREGVDSVSELVKKTKIPFMVLDSRELDDYKKILIQIGDTFDRAEVAKSLTSLWNAMWMAAPHVPGNKKVLVLIEWDPIIVAGTDSFLSEAFEKCHLKNVVAQKGYPRLNREALETHSPDVIIFAGHQGNDRQFSEMNLSLQKSPKLKNTIIINSRDEALGRLGPRLPVAIKEICSKVIGTKLGQESSKAIN